MNDGLWFQPQADELFSVCSAYLAVIFTPLKLKGKQEWAIQCSVESRLSLEDMGETQDKRKGTGQSHYNVGAGNTVVHCAPVHQCIEGGFPPQFL